MAAHRRWRPAGGRMSLRPDLAIIADHVVPGARVLDIGCGDGALMAALRDGRRVDARGLEIDSANVSAAIARGLSVVQGDAAVDQIGRAHVWNPVTNALPVYRLLP